MSQLKVRQADGSFREILMIKGDKGDKGDTGNASESINDNLTDTEHTWSSEKIDADKLDKTGDGSSVTTTFSQAITRENIESGEAIAASMGKISKYLEDTVTNDNFEDFKNKELSMYLMSGFMESDQSLHLWSSVDGIRFEHISKVYTPTTGILRDPSIIKYHGVYYIAYSTSWASNYFGIAKSVDLIHWTFVTHVYVSSTFSRAWAPELFVDDDDSVHAFISCDADDGVDYFKLCEMHPTNSDWTTWSTEVVITGDMVNNAIDAFMFKENGKYYLFYKNGVTTDINYAVSTTLLSGYVTAPSSSWSAWGTDIEGACCIKLPNGKYRVYFDSYFESKYYYSDSNDLITWTTRKEIDDPVPVRHSTVLCGTTVTKDILHARTLDYPVTWTPILKGSTTAGTPTYTTQSGIITKVGTFAYVMASVAISNKGGMTGAIQLTGLPFLGDGNFDVFDASGYSLTGGNLLHNIHYGNGVGYFTVNTPNSIRGLLDTEITNTFAAYTIKGIFRIS